MSDYEKGYRLAVQELKQAITQQLMNTEEALKQGLISHTVHASYKLALNDILATVERFQNKTI